MGRKGDSALGSGMCNSEELVEFSLYFCGFKLDGRLRSSVSRQERGLPIRFQRSCGSLPKPEELKRRRSSDPRCRGRMMPGLGREAWQMHVQSSMGAAKGRGVLGLRVSD